MKHTKKNLLISHFLILFGLLAVQVHGQLWIGDDEDVIYLKNGSILRGRIISQEVGQAIQIEIASGKVFTVNQSEISEIRVEPPKYRRISYRVPKSERQIQYREPGNFYHLISGGVNFTEARWGPIMDGGLSYRLAYHYNTHLNFGLGLGLDRFQQGTVYPIFLDLHGDLFKKKISPHYLVQAGYGFGNQGSPNHDVFRGGLMGHAGLGFTIHTTRRRKWSFTAGYKFQRTYQEFREWPGNIWWEPNPNPEPVEVKGHRFYQRIQYQLTLAF